MNLKLISLLVALMFIKCIDAEIVLECRFRSEILMDVSNEYTCEVENTALITSKSNRDISSVRTPHVRSNNNDNVEHFSSWNNQINYFPRGLTKFFKNIRIVSIGYADLKEISKDDLKEFGEKLQKLQLSNNLIEVIESNLFEFNPNLSEVILRENKIRHIESGGLNGLQKLDNRWIYGAFFRTKAFSFEGNPCQQFDTVNETETNCKDNATTTQKPN